MSPNSINSVESPKSISNVVGNHADRVMDELFADIEELLSGEVKDRPAALTPGQTTGQNVPQQTATPTYPQLPPTVRVPGEAPITNEPVTALNPPKRGAWKTVVAGLSLMAIAAGGGVWWLAKEGKITLPKLPNLNAAANGDVQFSDYVRRATSKIENKGATNQVSIPNPPTTQAAVPAVPGAMNPVSMTRVIPGNPPIVEFLIDNKLQQLRGGDKIGNSGWSLTTVINTNDSEVIIKRDSNGEMRSIKVGQSF
jgi:hypothetical protein